MVFFFFLAGGGGVVMDWQSLSCFCWLYIDLVVKKGEDMGISQLKKNVSEMRSDWNSHTWQCGSCFLTGFFALVQHHLVHALPETLPRCGQNVHGEAKSVQQTQNQDSLQRQNNRWWMMRSVFSGAEKKWLEWNHDGIELPHLTDDWFY